MISCIIVDDEQHAIDILEHYIKQTPDLQLRGSFTDPVEALRFVGTTSVDLVFLDIQMPHLSGIDFIKAVQGKNKVILTTAYSEFALEGYDLYVVDYLMKPIRFPRFLSAVQKATDQIQAIKVKQSADKDHLFVKTEIKGKLLKITLADIDYIEGMKNYVAIHSGTQKTLVYTSMKELEEHLPANEFLRIHKSFIIPLSRITGIEGNMVRLKNVQAGIQIGETYKEDLMNRIKNRTIH